MLENPRIDPSDCVVIIGPVPIGLFSIMAARAGWDGTIVNVGVSADEVVLFPLPDRLVWMQSC